MGDSCDNHGVSGGSFWDECMSDALPSIFGAEHTWSGTPQETTDLSRAANTKSTIMTLSLVGHP